VVAPNIHQGFSPRGAMAQRRPRRAARALRNLLPLWGLLRIAKVYPKPGPGGWMPGIRKGLRLAAVWAFALGLTPSAGFAKTTLRFIPQADLLRVAPIWTTA